MKAVAWPEAHRLPSWNLPSNPESEVLGFTPSILFIVVARLQEARKGGAERTGSAGSRMKGALTFVAQGLTVSKLSGQGLNPGQSGFRFSSLSFLPALVKTGRPWEKS